MLLTARMFGRCLHLLSGPGLSPLCEPYCLSLCEPYCGPLCEPYCCALGEPHRAPLGEHNCAVLNVAYCLALNVNNCLGFLSVSVATFWRFVIFVHNPPILTRPMVWALNVAECCSG